jgi:hypothetical protein
MNTLTRLDTTGISVHPTLEGRAVLLSMAFAAGITLAGSMLPLGWLNRLNLSALLRAE